VRAVAIHEDLIVFISRVWQTTATAVRAGGEGFLIDSVVYPDELAAVPGVLEQAGFPITGLLATHGDWDHLLGRLAYPEASLGCGESTAVRLEAELGAPQRALRSFDEEHYVDGRAPLSLAAVQSLPLPGRLSIGDPDDASGAPDDASGTTDREIQLHPAAGHTADGTAYWLPWLKILVCGDYLSPVEIPMLSPGGTLDAYEQTLARLGPLVEQSATVIPGHGAPIPGEQAAGILAQDLAYIQALRDQGAGAPLPDGRRTRHQRQIHADNVARLA
jgi:glyoxylase-like metal-dependent hydrolase (beta-lactamase superfamily II)